MVTVRKIKVIMLFRFINYFVTCKLHVKQIQVHMPFVCLNKPFIHNAESSIKPFICHNKPFIGISKYQGFTLIELIITLVIAGLLGAIALPNFQNFIKDNRLKTQTAKMVSHLQLARSEAAKQKARVTICTSSNGNTCTAGTDWNKGWIVWTEKDGNAGITANEEILKREGASIQTIAINAGTDTLDYTPDGTVITPGGGVVQFTFCDDRTAENGRQITIALTGRAESERFVCP